MTTDGSPNLTGTPPRPRASRKDGQKSGHRPDLLKDAIAASSQTYTYGLLCVFALTLVSASSIHGLNILLCSAKHTPHLLNRIQAHTLSLPDPLAMSVHGAVSWATAHALVTEA